MAKRDAYDSDDDCRYLCIRCNSLYNTREEQRQCSRRCRSTAAYQTAENRSPGEQFLQDDVCPPTGNCAYQPNFNYPAVDVGLSRHGETPNSTASDYSYTCSPYAVSTNYQDGSILPATYHPQAQTQGNSQKYETNNATNDPVGSQESVFVNEVQGRGSSRVLEAVPSTVTPQNSQESSTSNRIQGSQESTDSTYGSSPVSPSLSSSNSAREWTIDEQDHKSKRPTLTARRNKLDNNNKKKIKIIKNKKDEDLIEVKSSKYPEIEEMARTHALNQVESAIRKKTNSFISKSDGGKFFCIYAAKCHGTPYSTKQKAQDHIMSEHLSEYIRLECKQCGEVIGKGRFYNARKHKCIRDPSKTDIYKCPCPVPGQKACQKFNNIYDLKKHLCERSYHYKDNLEEYKEIMDMKTNLRFKRFFEDKILTYIREDSEKTNKTPVSTSKFASWPKLKGSLEEDWFREKQDDKGDCPLVPKRRRLHSSNYFKEESKKVSTM